MIQPKKYIRALVPSYMYSTRRTKDILNINPTAAPKRNDAEKIKICIYDYNASYYEEKEAHCVEDTFYCKGNDKITWINIDGLRKKDVEMMSSHFGIHPLLAEDILSM